MKIFGIGLSRTGTLSLTHGLEMLGFRAKHFPRIEQEILTGKYQLESVQDFDALTDTPVAPIFAQLDATHPNSKFILTVRPLDDWLDACSRFFAWQDREVADSPFARVVVFQRLYVYGCGTFNRDRWAYVYETHTRNVQHHFATRPSDLLIMNIRAGDGFAVLCPFLGRAPVLEPFPHSNAFTDVSGAAIQVLDHSADAIERPSTVTQ